MTKEEILICLQDMKKRFSNETVTVFKRYNEALDEVIKIIKECKDAEIN